MAKIVAFLLLLNSILIIYEGTTLVDGLYYRVNQRVCETHIQPGDIMLGGLMHVYLGLDDICHGNIYEAPLSYIEAMIYAVNSINERPDLLPNVTLGYEIRPDCGSYSLTMWSTFSLNKALKQSEYDETCELHDDQGSQKVVAIIGPGLSSTSILAAPIGRIFDVPVVSYSASSDELSDPARFPYFFRTVPADRFQAEVIADILDHYNWKYVELFYSLNSYGIHGARQLSRLTENAEVCIPVNMAISLQPTRSDLTEIASKLVEHDKVTVIVIFSYVPMARTVLRVIRDQNIDRKLIFIGTDGWEYDQPLLDEFANLLVGSIFIVYKTEIPLDFEMYYKDLPNKQELASVWYRKKLNEMAAHNGNCTDWTMCPIPRAHPATEYVIDAVNAVAHALNATLQGQSDRSNIDGWTLRQNLFEVTFVTNTNKTFRFKTHGDVPGSYWLTMGRTQDGNFKKVSIGSWSAVADSRLDLEEVAWENHNGKLPISLCFEECMPGYIEVPLKKKCCWGCQRCHDYAIVVNIDNTSRCHDCPVTHWPNANFTECLTIAHSFLDYRDTVFVVSVAGSSLGLCLTAFASYGLYVYSDNSLIKASGIDLSCINLIGLAFLCVASIINLLQPNKATCVVFEICISTSFCITFTPVLLKVNRIWRIFYLQLGEELRFASARSQIAISCIIIGVQLLIACSSVFFAPSSPNILLPPQRQELVEIYCRFDYGFLASCAYNSLIIIGCCFYAFKARKIPDNFNESKFIGISVYSTVIICLSAIPVYILAIQVAQMVGALSVTLLANTYLTLLCLYLPKMYAIRFNKNDQEGGTGTRSNWFFGTRGAQSQSKPMSSIKQVQRTGIKGKKEPDQNRKEKPDEVQ